MADQDKLKPIVLDYATPEPKKKISSSDVLYWIVIGAIVLFLTAIFLPDFLSHQHVAKKPMCANNLHQIGIAIMQYVQNDNQSRFPSDLAVLGSNCKLPTKLFTCPSSNDTPAHTYNQLYKPSHLSYVYLPPTSSGLYSLTPDVIIMYEPLKNHGDGMNILFGDFHVEFIPSNQAKKILHELQLGHNPPDLK